MKAFIKNKNCENFNKSYKVKKMNYNDILAENDIVFEYDEVNLEPENKIDEFLVANREMLKIHLKRGISVNFYMFLHETLEAELSDEVKIINVIKDKTVINKRKIWDKQIVIMLNKKEFLEINASGRSFAKADYNIVINKISKEDFINLCSEEIEKLKRQYDIVSGSLSRLQNIFDIAEKVEN